ncbi:MAG: hypothetical protein NVS2B3_08950 [Vulcanimicrobiaceae bacterium]
MSLFDLDEYVGSTSFEGLDRSQKDSFFMAFDIDFHERHVVESQSVDSSKWDFRGSTTIERSADAGMPRDRRFSKASCEGGDI